MVLSRSIMTSLRMAQPTLLRAATPVAGRPFFAIRAFSHKYSKSHEYLNIVGDKAFVGISDFAQAQLGDVVYVELPEVGASFEKGEMFGSVESVKAASDVYLPVGGEIVEVNSSLETSPENVNTDAETDAWFVQIKIADPSEADSLMDQAAYEKFCEEEEA